MLDRSPPLLTFIAPKLDPVATSKKVNVPEMRLPVTPVRPSGAMASEYGVEGSDKLHGKDHVPPLKVARTTCLRNVLT